MVIRILVAYTALALLFTNVSYAQQTGVLKGKVTSNTNNDAISSATIRLVNNPAKGTVTDPDGIFSIVLDTGFHKVMCQYVGLLPDTFVVHISANVIAEKNIVLQSSSEVLNTVVISSGKFNQVRH